MATPINPPEAWDFRDRVKRQPISANKAFAIALGKPKRQAVKLRKPALIEYFMEEYAQDKERVWKQFRASIGEGEAAPGVSKDEVRNILETEVKAAVGHALVGMDTEALQATMVQHAEQIAIEALKKYRPIEVRQTGKRPKRMKRLVPENFETMVQLAQSGQNIMMVGPAGSGKTTLAEFIGEAIGARQFASISCSMGMSESMLSGWLLPTGRGGTFEYHASPFVDVYENGGVFLLDEVDNADPNTLTFLNTALAGRFFHLPQRFDNPLVKKHPDFVCIAAANTWGTGADTMYIGRNALDAATLDRFRSGMIEVDYSPLVERGLVDDDVYLWGLKIRTAIRQFRLERILSTRTMVNMQRLKTDHGWGHAEWNDVYFRGWSDQEVEKMKSVGCMTDPNANQVWSTLEADNIKARIDGTQIIIDGTTFPHRAHIKATGARFDGPQKVWKMDATPDNRAAVWKLIEGIKDGTLTPNAATTKLDNTTRLAKPGG